MNVRSCHQKLDGLQQKINELLEFEKSFYLEKLCVKRSPSYVNFNFIYVSYVNVKLLSFITSTTFNKLVIIKAIIA